MKKAILVSFTDQGTIYKEPNLPVGVLKTGQQQKELRF